MKTNAPHDHDSISIEDVEDAISTLYHQAAEARPGVTMNHDSEPLRTLWAMADAEYAKED